MDEEVHHEPQIAEALGKREKPDRIYGLRETRNIENLLHDTAVPQGDEASSDGPGQVQEVLGLPHLDQPMNMSGDRQLFPFLVLEAKSGSSGDSWQSIRLQTAFSIRTFLETQRRLRLATGSRSKWRSGPFVWFLSNKGEDWRLSAAYTTQGAAKRHTVGETEFVSLCYSCKGVLETTRLTNL